MTRSLRTRHEPTTTMDAAGGTGLPAGVAPASALALVALVDALAMLYPDGEVRIGARASLRDRSTVSYAVVPGFGDPRLMVPLVPGRAASRSLRRYSASTSYRDSVARASASALTRVTRAFLQDRVVVADAGHDSMLRHLAERLGRPVVASLGVGTDRVNRKPVLQLFDERGDPLGFAKIGDTPRAVADVAAEASALRRVAGHDWDHLRAPRVLDESVWRNLSVLVISPLATGPGQAQHDGTRPPVAAMEELAASFAGGSSRLSQMPWWDRQRAGVELLSDVLTRERLERCTLALADRAGNRLLRVGAWHGDWTPWNMAGGRGPVRLWDWERFEEGAPAGLDRLHYAVNVATADRDARPMTVAAALPPVDDSPLSLLADLYLVAIAVRYLTLAEACPGARGADRGRCMLQVLEGRLGLAL